MAIGGAGSAGHRQLRQVSQVQNYRAEAQVIEHLFVAKFKLSQEFARSVARAKAGGFSIGWVADDR